MITAHINIGSNLGNRAANISRAVDRIDQCCGAVESISAPYESAPWGYDSPNQYLNAGINLRTSLSIQQLMQQLKAVEAELAPGQNHRDSRGKYADRTIDLDLIAYGTECLQSDSITVPHPRMHLRDFVLIPMAQVWPCWEHPLLHLTPQQLLHQMQ